MLGKVILFFGVVIAVMIGIHTALENGSVLRLIDEHHDPRWAPYLAYTVGQGYYLFQSLPEAATYFIRVPNQYPESSLADDAYFYYVQALDDSATVNRPELMADYNRYLELYPKGEHAVIARNRIDAYSTGSR